LTLLDTLFGQLYYLLTLLTIKMRYMALVPFKAHLFSKPSISTCTTHKPILFVYAIKPFMSSSASLACLVIAHFTKRVERAVVATDCGFAAITVPNIRPIANGLFV